MRVDELMSGPKCCGEGDSVRRCAKLMKEQSIGFVPICDDDGKPIGAVTDRDLAIRVLAEGRTADEAIATFMTRDVVACRAGDDVEDAERLMRERRKSRIMVCDDQGQLVGVVSLADVADVTSSRAAGQTLQQVKSDQPTAH
jgi:CBS domain-containing protein